MRINGLWTCSLQLDKPTYVPASRTMALTLQCSPATTHYFGSAYYQVLTATHLPTLMKRLRDQGLDQRHLELVFQAKASQ